MGLSRVRVGAPCSPPFGAALLASLVALILLLWAAPADAAISQLGTTQTATNGSGSSSLSISVPAQAGVGDTLVLVVTGAGSTAIPTPAGWVSRWTSNPPVVSSVGRVFTRVVQASEPTSVSVNLGAWREANAVLTAWQDIDTAAPLEDLGEAYWTGSSVTGPTVTTAAPGALIMAGITWSGLAGSSSITGATALHTPLLTATALTSHAGYVVQGAQGNSPAISFASGGGAYNYGAGTFAFRRMRRPAVNATTSPASPSSSNTPVVTGTNVDAGWTVTLYSSSSCSGGALGSGTGSAFTSTGITATVTSDTTTTIYARAVDPHGNISDCSATGATFVEDSTAPGAPATGGPTSGNTRSPQFTYTPAEGGGTFECRVTGGSLPGTWGACSTGSTHTANLTGQPDATYTFQVRQRDAAGNTGAAGSRTYALDATAPAAPTVTAPSSPDDGRSPQWTFTGEAGGTFSCRVTGGTLPGTWGSCTTASSHTGALSGQADGSYTFEVRQTDAATNVGATGSSTYVLDTSAPVAPTIVAAPQTPDDERNPSWSFTGEAGGTYECRLVGGTLPGTWASCAGAQAYNLTGQADGTYTFGVRQTDTAGNVGAIRTGTYVLDDTDPAAPSVTAPPSPDDARTPTWSYAGEPGGSYECRVTGGTLPGTWGACTTGATHVANLSGQADGTYTFAVRQTDAAGNLGAERTSAYALDTTAPEDPVMTGPASPDNDPSPAWTITAEPGASVECRMELDGGEIFDWAACPQPLTANLANAPDGTWTAYARAKDAAGNVSGVVSAAYVYDKTAPAVPSVTGPAPSPGREEAPSWGFSGEPGGSFECRLTGGSLTGEWTSCAIAQGYSLSAQPDGTYTFGVRQTDAAGNVSPIASNAYVLDRSAPAPPSVTAPASPDDSRGPTWSFTGETGGTFECRVTGGSLPGGWGACATGSTHTADLSGQADGAYAFAVRQTDGAGNTGTAATNSYVLDTAAPAAPSVTGPGSPDDDRSVAWTFSGEAGGTYECRVTGGSLAGGWASCASPTSDYDLTGQADGTYTFEVRQTDAAGNVGAIGSDAYTLDDTGPAAPTIVAAPQTPDDSRDPSWSFTGEAGGTYACRLVGGTLPGTWASCAGAQAYSLTGQADGTYTFEVVQTDASGNAGAARASAYVLDTTGPAAPAVVAPSSPDDSRAPSWSFTGEAGGTFECRVTGGTLPGAWGSCATAGTHGASLTGQADGTYTLAVRQTDAAGNVGSTASSAYVLDTEAPGAPSITGPSSPDNARDPSWTVLAEAGSAAECRIDRDGVQVDDWAPCAGARPLDLSVGVDGTYTLSARASDAAGNVSPVATSAYRLDTVAPAPPALDGPASPSSARVPSWGFAGESGGTFDCRLDRGGTQIFGWTDCAGAHGFDLTGEADGTYTFSVRQTDAAGNVGDAATGSYVLDTTGPAAPTVTAPASPANDRSPGWTFSGESGGSYACRTTGGTLPGTWSACTSPATSDLTGQGSGTYTFEVRQTDASANQGAVGTATYVLDVTPPAAPVITGAAGAGSGTAPSWSFSREAGTSAECRLDGPGGAVAGWASCDGAEDYDLAGEPDGDYTFSVRAIDAVGNAGPADSDVYTLNTARPDPPTLTASPASPGRSRAPAWSFTGQPGETFDCRVVSGPTVVADWGPCTSGDSVDLSGRSDGTYTFSVRAVNGVGTASASTTGTYVLDTTAPAAPAIDATPGSATDPTPTWAFSGEASVSFECRITRGASVIEDWDTCSASRTYDVSTAGDGLYTFAVRAIDVAGNTSAAASSDWTRDTTAPAAPQIVTSPGAVGRSRAPGWTFTAPGATAIECRLTGGTLAGAWAPCGPSADFDLTGEADGTFTFAVRGSDAAGNTSAATTQEYRLDTAAPAAPTITGGPGARGAGATPVWTFTGEAGAAYECRLLRGGSTVADWATCATPRGFDLVSAPDGAYRFEVRATDPAGNTGTASGSDYALDRSVPGAPAITAAPGPVGSRSAVSWSFAGDPGSTLECRLTQGASAVAEWGACSATRAFDLGGLPDGAYDFAVRARNDLGTAGPAATSRYVLDRAAPAAPTVVGGPGELGRTRTPVWAFTAEPGDALECRVLRGGAVAEDWAACTSPRGHDLTGAADGPVTFAVRAVDGAGNRSVPRESAYELDTTAPAAPRITDGPGESGTHRRPSWAFTSEPAASFECRLKGPGRDGNWATCSAPRAFDLADADAGAYDFAVRATDRAGNTGPVRTATYTLRDPAREQKDDDTPPARTTGEPPAPARQEERPRQDAAEPSSAAAGAAPSDAGRGPDAEGSEAIEGAAARRAAAARRRAAAPAASTPAARRPRSSDGAPVGTKKDDSGPKGAPGKVAEAVAGAAKQVAQVATKAAEVAAENADKSVFPGGLLLMVGAFLSIQGRIDRNDPKLALAPAEAEQDVSFDPPTPPDEPTA